MMERISLRWFAIAAFIVLSLCPQDTNGDNDWDLEEDTGGWIDPHSMLEDKPFKKPSIPEREVVYETCEKADSDCSVAEKSLTECGDQVTKLKKDLEKQKELYRKSETTAAKEQPFFEQFIRHILGLFTNVQDSMNVGHYEAAISLTGLNYGYLSSYVTKQNASVQEVHSILLKLMTNVRWVREELNEFDDGLEMTFAAKLLYGLNVAGAVAIVMVALLQIVSLLRRVRMSLSRFVFLLFVTTIITSFVISIPWTWWHLYKKKVAERMASMSKGVPDCGNSGFWRTIFSHFYIQSDECQMYFEQLEIDPLWEVPPTQAVAVTFVRFFLEPAKHVGQAIREFMVSAFEGLPFVLWIPVYAIIIILIILVFFCLGRYRIYTPFLRIEPAHHQDNNAHQIAALQDRVEQLQVENRDMRQQLALPDARGNAVVNDRGDRRQTPLPLVEPPARVQDVERHDVKTTEENISASPVKTTEKKKSTSPVKMQEKGKSTSPVRTPETGKSTTSPLPAKLAEKSKSTPKTVKDVPVDSQRVETLSSLCSAAIPDEATPVSVMGKPIREESISESELENLPTAGYAEPNKDIENVDLSDERPEMNSDDLQQSFVIIGGNEDTEFAERK